MYEMYVRVTFNFNKLLQDFRGRASFFVWPSIYICELTQRESRQREEDGKPCVTSVKTIVFENNFRQTSPYFL